MFFGKSRELSESSSFYNELKFFRKFKEVDNIEERVKQLPVKNSGNNAICLESEYYLWPAKWQRVNRNNDRTKIPETALDVHEVCNQYMFPTNNFSSI